ncbi:MAG: cyclic nucleotide-binding domain-containing protein [Blastocatellia bacterium]|nr:cyclic nucleotide-binding domain-containing protein [Blastocatellia bacterium]
MFEAFPEGELDFLRDCELFSDLSEKTLQAIFKRGRIVKLEPGQELFSLESPADNFYVVKSGVVEIWRHGDTDPDEKVSVAFLGRGESVGEMRMLTGSPHSSAARAPEGGEVFELPQRSFRGILETFPEFAIRLCHLFAERLESTVKNLGVQRKRQFHGHLKYFDLASVIQTIVVSRMTGKLIVTDDFGNNYAEMYFNLGNCCTAHVGHLRGAQAFYQLFQPPPVEGLFDFKSDATPPEFDPEEEEGFQPGMNMLMEAIRMQDELETFRPEIKIEDIYQPQGEELRWEGEEAYVVLANDIWYRLHKEQPTVVQLMQEVPYCHYNIYYVLVKLKNTRQILSSMDSGAWPLESVGIRAAFQLDDVEGEPGE